VGDRRRDLLLALRAAGDLRRVHATSKSGTALVLGGAALDVPGGRVFSGRDAALPHGDRPVHHPAGGAGAYAVAQITYPVTVQLPVVPPCPSRALICAPVRVVFGVRSSISTEPKPPVISPPRPTSFLPVEQLRATP